MDPRNSLEQLVPVSVPNTPYYPFNCLSRTSRRSKLAVSRPWTRGSSASSTNANRNSDRRIQAIYLNQKIERLLILCKNSVIFFLLICNGRYNNVRIVYFHSAAKRITPLDHITCKIGQHIRAINPKNRWNLVLFYTILLLYFNFCLYLDSSWTLVRSTTKRTRVGYSAWTEVWLLAPPTRGSPSLGKPPFKIPFNVN